MAWLIHIAVQKGEFLNHKWEKIRSQKPHLPVRMKAWQMSISQRLLLVSKTNGKPCGVPSDCITCVMKKTNPFYVLLYLLSKGVCHLWQPGLSISRLWPWWRFLTKVYLDEIRDYRNELLNVSKILIVLMDFS